VLRANGSGSATLEYRVSRLLEGLGKLDGNNNWPIIPTGRTDIERTVNRIDGLKLVSFSAKEDDRDALYTVKLDFTSADALVHFLDATGQRASLTRDGAKTRLSVILTGGFAHIDPDLLALFTAVSAPYSIALSFSTPTDAALSLSTATGGPLDASDAVVVSSGKKVSFTTPLPALLNHKDGAALDLVW
jgi:hypothetical protein